MIVTTVLLAGAALFGALKGKSIYSAIVARIKGVPTVVAAKGTALARLAEQEGKIVALKAASAVKKAEAAAAHAALDEFDSLIG
jgi:hypothetical protein